MPNWCSNRACFYAERGQIIAIQALADGDLTPYYRRAVNEGIQLFVAGCAGLLQVTEDIQYVPYPGLTAAGRGVVLPENLAFTRWLEMLQNGVELDTSGCRKLHELWQQSDIGWRRWDSLSDGVQAEITRLYSARRHDWSGLWSRKDVSAWWEQLCENPLPDRTCPFDLLQVLPSRLDVEINGFNGKLMTGIPTAYDWYLARYGTKWPMGYELNVSLCGDDFIQIDFDTPWSPPDAAVMEELSRRYNCVIEHWYAEQGCDFCGYARYVNGETDVYITDELEWGEADPDDEDSCPDVTGPEWIINNVAHYGG
ncbi:DUF1281 domain-containing protein [Salmonella enterica]|nr:DUF1281 domain-containing protein [Salmonella enterica]EAM8741906.1 DUF1281 domain-containing protein [Salmonella enterica]EAZ9079015.1 DUF1281 domain-containing protein [Salmonella enterica]